MKNRFGGVPIPVNAIVVLLLLMSCSSESNLEVRDLYQAGDGLITYDPRTNLEWLDLTMSVNLSMYEARWDLAPNSPLRNWRIATVAEFVELFEHNVREISPNQGKNYAYSFKSSESETAKLGKLVAYFGMDSLPGGNLLSVGGYLETASTVPADGSFALARMNYYVPEANPSSNSSFASIVYLLAGDYLYDASSSIGIFYVRESKNR